MKTKLYTLEEAIEIYKKRPSGADGLWLDYVPKHIREIIKDDYFGEKKLEEKLFSDSAEPKIFGILVDNPDATNPDEEVVLADPYYPEEYQHLLAKGRKPLWLMNLEYLENLQYELERREYDPKKYDNPRISRKMLKNKLHDTLQKCPPSQSPCDMVYDALAQEMIQLTEHLNRKIQLSNSCKDIEYNRYKNILNFFKNPHTQWHIQEPGIVETLKSHISDLEIGIRSIDCSDDLLEMETSIRGDIL